MLAYFQPHPYGRLIGLTADWNELCPLFTELGHKIRHSRIVREEKRFGSTTARGFRPASENGDKARIRTARCHQVTSARRGGLSLFSALSSCWRDLARASGGEVAKPPVPFQSHLVVSVRWFLSPALSSHSYRRSLFVSLQLFLQRPDSNSPRGAS